MSFEDILKLDLVAKARHLARPNQEILLIAHEDYIGVVPFVWEEGEIP